MKLDNFQCSLDTLSRTISNAAEFFTQVDETLDDGHQTARQCLSHLVFWHREYLNISRDLLTDRQPGLRHGTFKSLNAQAYQEFQDESLSELAGLLVELQCQLDASLRALVDTNPTFPLKQGGHPWKMTDLVPRIEAHVRNHITRSRLINGI